MDEVPQMFRDGAVRVLGFATDCLAPVQAIKEAAPQRRDKQKPLRPRTYDAVEMAVLQATAETPNLSAVDSRLDAIRSFVTNPRKLAETEAFYDWTNETTLPPDRAAKIAHELINISQA